MAHAADEQRVVAAELYGDFHGGCGEREAESERGDGEARESERSGGGASGVHQGERRGAGARGMKVGAQLAHGHHARCTRQPLGQFREQLAGDGVDMVGS